MEPSQHTVTTLTAAFNYNVHQTTYTSDSLFVFPAERLVVRCLVVLVHHHHLQTVTASLSYILVQITPPRPGQSPFFLSLVGRLGSGVRLNASFQRFPRQIRGGVLTLTDHVRQQKECLRRRGEGGLSGEV